MKKTTFVLTLLVTSLGWISTLICIFICMVMGNKCPGEGLFIWIFILGALSLLLSLPMSSLSLTRYLLKPGHSSDARLYVLISVTSILFFPTYKVYEDFLHLQKFSNNGYELIKCCVDDLLVTFLLSIPNLVNYYLIRKRSDPQKILISIFVALLYLFLLIALCGAAPFL